MNIANAKFKNYVSRFWNSLMAKQCSSFLNFYYSFEITFPGTLVSTGRSSSVRPTSTATDSENIEMTTAKAQTSWDGSWPGKS